MGNCTKCGKEVEIKLSRFFTFNGLCDSCNEKRLQEVEKENKLKKIMENLGYYYGYDLEGDDKDYEWFVKIKNRKIISKIHLTTLKKELQEKGITETHVQKILDFEDELNKIKEREKKLKLREKAEKQYYGKVKTKRTALNESEKEMILRKFGSKCSICNAPEGLHIHHKDKNPKNNRMDNLIVLCGICHKKIHMKVR